MFQGLWLPLVTPFKDGAIDFASYTRLVEHYIALGVDGLVPLALPAKDQPSTTTRPRRWSRRRSMPRADGCR